MRVLTLFVLAIIASFSLSSCGILAHQVHRTKNLLTAPFRVELERRFLDGIPELERAVRVPLNA